MNKLIVSTKLGKILGRIDVDIRGGAFYSFQGIPYAKPPIGPLRFKSPQPPDAWAGIRDGTQDGSACFHRDPVFKELVGDEDCLFLNVFTPSSVDSDAARKPVMFWIHGGGFTSGSNSHKIYGPEYLVADDVVVVTINYRLGVLGFLCLDDPGLGVPGNAGLKDVVMALKWVQADIERFGGDPDNVTIFGESAGGAAVHYLVLSPMAKGLFHKAIAQSGCALNPWAMGRRCAKDLAETLNLQTVNEKRILETLRKLPVDELFLAAEKLPDAFLVDRIRPHGPVVERPSNEPAFLDNSPLDVIKSGNYNQVPFIIGYTNREGMLSETFQNQRIKTRLFDDFELAIPHFLNLKKGSQISRAVAQKIQEFYFGQKDSFEDVDKYYIIETDNFFLRDLYNAVKYHAETSSTPLYLYRISVETQLNIFKIFTDIRTKGVCHADDLGYLFKTAISPDLKAGSLEDLSVRRFTKLWTNFARYGNPNPAERDPLINVKWAPVGKDEINFIDIGKELTVDVNPESERMAFWDEILNVNPAKCKL